MVSESTRPHAEEHASQSEACVSKHTNLGFTVLRHAVRRSVFARPQQGQRGRRLASAAAIRRRIVAIELGTCRSGRSGGASGSIIFGNDNVREQRGGTSS